jgi:peptidyl-prolyl cis-trans isomerase B (cyclophilin B)
MANKGYPNSAGSQFFIVVADSTHLDGKYTAFARVTQGMEVADAIVAVEADGRARPLENVVVRSVTILE